SHSSSGRERFFVPMKRVDFTAEFEPRRISSSRKLCTATMKVSASPRNLRIGGESSIAPSLFDRVAGWRLDRCIGARRQAEPGSQLIGEFRWESVLRIKHAVEHVAFQQVHWRQANPCLGLTITRFFLEARPDALRQPVEPN